jgi:hypothetical protein
LNQTKNSNFTLRSHLASHKKIKSLLQPLSQYYFSLTGPLRLLPNYLIIGAAKSGTSSLYEYLIQHPNVQPASGKEIYFFDMNYDKGINWYRTFFPLSNNFSKTAKNSIVGEATPRYLDHPHAPYRIKKYIPNCKFIILLRNPIDRAYSHWNMMVNHNREDLSFEEAIDKEKNRTNGLFEKMAKDKSFYSKEYYWYSYLERGIYSKKIKKWFEIFPKNQFLILKSEDLFSKPSEIFHQTQDFLNIPKIILDEFKTVRKGIYKNKSISSNTRKSLSDFFKPYNEELYSLIGVNLGWEE